MRRNWRGRKIEDEPMATPLTPYEQGLVEIKKRCDVAKIVSRETKGFLDDNELEIDFPAGHSTRRLDVVSEDDVQALLAIAFEQFRFVESYNAVVNYSAGTIEAAVRPPAGTALTQIHRILFAKKVARSTPPEKLTLDSGDALIFQWTKQKPALEVRLGPRSSEFVSFSTVAMWQTPPFTLRITGAKISTNTEALTLLEKIANAFFFEIDLVLGIPFILEKERRVIRSRKGTSNVTGKQLVFPSSQHDSRPMSLYWYARLSRGMPLLQFLGFYQVVEFYYPMFSELDAIQKLKVIIKDPRFDVHNDSEVGKILRAIKGSPRGFGSELSQLQSTIRSCVDAKELRVFLTDDEARKTFYESNFKGVAKQPIPIKDPKAELLQEVAQRIYEIRCRIVHTKDTAVEIETEPLLPFTKEAEQLYMDIELMEFVAMKVLVAASRKFEV